jgi:CBS domain containing-hemolysin-like protein
VIRQEREVLHNILDLSEITVEEVMRPRGTYVAKAPPVHLADLQGSVPPGDYLLILAEDGEDIEAAVPLADFVAVPEMHLESAAEPVVHVPWCANLADTLTLMREQFAGVAAVVNEYGEMIGIVTFEDIIETMLVPEASRTRRVLQREPILEIAPGRFHVEGLTTLRHLCKRLGIEHEPDEDSRVTVSGMLNEQLEHLPAVGDECRWREYRFRVLDVSRHGQVRVIVELEPAPAR